MNEEQSGTFESAAEAELLPELGQAQGQPGEGESGGAVEGSLSPGPLLSGSLHLGLTRREMNWAATAHASIVLTVLLGLATGGVGAIVGIAVPAVIWYSHRGRSDYVVEQARQATLFQIAGFALLLALAIVGSSLVVIGWVVTALLTVVLVGLVLLPFMLIVTVLLVVALVGLPIAQVVYGCFAAVEAHSGRPFRYHWMDALLTRTRVQV